MWFDGQSFSAFGLPTMANTDATVLSTAPDFDPGRLDEIRSALDVERLFVVADAGTEIPEVDGCGRRS